MNWKLLGVRTAKINGGDAFAVDIQINTLDLSLYLVFCTRVTRPFTQLDYFLCVGQISDFYDRE